MLHTINEMKYTSAGVIPYMNSNKKKNNEENILILIIFTRDGYWDFPKGGVKSVDNNILLNTACRELEEETGITAKDIEYIDLNNCFIYNYKVKKKIKNVKLFPCLLKSEIFYKTLNYDINEIIHHEFVTLKELPSRFKFKETKKIAEDIVHFFQKKIIKT